MVNKKNLIIISVSSIILIVLIALGLNLKNIQKEKKVSSDITLTLSGLSAQAQNLLVKGNLAEAKLAFQKLVNFFPSSNEVMNWQKKIEEINIKLLFSPVVTPKSILYEIKPGDTLTKIAREFKTTTDLIMKSNNLPNDRIVPGRRIKVWTAPFNIFVDKSQNTLLLKTEEEIVKTYVVSTGKNNLTPVGTFKITNKLMNPTWFKAGTVVPPSSPENILGTRWLGFDLAGYGIHGTSEPQSLGKQVTQGCVRMSNSDVEELYTIVPLGTEVTIVD
jgi:lipoprotein-anchoring transpeptidase ErfK/SrfK